MNDDFVSLFTFNRWANARMLDACRTLTPEQYAAEPVAGFEFGAHCAVAAVPTIAPPLRAK